MHSFDRYDVTAKVQRKGFRQLRIQPTSRISEPAFHKRELPNLESLSLSLSELVTCVAKMLLLFLSGARHVCLDFESPSTGAGISVLCTRLSDVHQIGNSGRRQ